MHISRALFALSPDARCLNFRLNGVGDANAVRSNGTYVNEQKLSKKQTRSLQPGDNIFLYRALSAAPLGHTIMYHLDVDESSFGQVCCESEH